MKLGGDGGYNEPYIIQDNINICKCCGRKEDTRMRICWDCAECESVIGEGVDMYGKDIPRIEGYSFAMAKLQYIIKRFREDLR